MNEKISLFEDLYTGLNQAIEIAKGTELCNITMYAVTSAKMKGHKNAHRKIIALHNNQKRRTKARKRS